MSGLSEFRFNFGYFWGGHSDLFDSILEIESDGSKKLCCLIKNKPQVITIHNETEFICMLEEIPWHQIGNKYYMREIDDGTSWMLSVSWNGVSHKVAGHCACPNALKNVINYLGEQGIDVEAFSDFDNCSMSELSNSQRRHTHVLDMINHGFPTYSL